MNLSRRLWPVAAACAAAVLPALVAPPATAQPPVMPTVSGRGDHALRHTLKMHGLMPLARMDLSAAPADETVVLILGDLTRSENLQVLLSELRPFVDRGGALLVATDQPTFGRLRGFRAAVTGAGVRIPDRVGLPPQVWIRSPNFNLVLVNRGDYLREKDQRYKDYTVLEVQLEFSDAPPRKIDSGTWQRQQASYFKYSDFILVQNHFDKPHPLFSGCDKGIVVNQPSFIVRGENCEFPVLSSFPPFRSQDNVEVDLPAFAIGTDNPDAPGRFLLLSSYSQFWNSAYVQRETDNKAFLSNTVTWLAGGKKPRKFALYVYEGAVVSNFDVPLMDLPVPTRQMLNQLLRDMEEENFFNDLIVGEKPLLLRIGVVMAVVALGLYGLLRYLRAPFRRDYAVPLVEAKQVFLSADDTPPVVRREQQRLRAGDFSEAARALARECFETAPVGRGAAAPPAIPPGNSHLAAAVAALWTLAFSDGDGRPVNADAFGRIAALAEQVRKAFTQGELHWDTPEHKGLHGTHP